MSRVEHSHLSTQQPDRSPSDLEWHFGVSGHQRDKHSHRPKPLFTLEVRDLTRAELDKVNAFLTALR